MPQKIAISISSGSRPACSAPARTWSTAQRTAAGLAPTWSIAMSASAPATRRLRGPVVAGERVGDADAELDPLRRLKGARHIDPDVLPEHLRVDDPGAVVTGVLGGLHALHEHREVLGQEVGADLHALLLSRAAGKVAS